jgi:putative membrane protein insertion efficiency factor
LKQITAPYSNDVSAPRDERPLAVRLALALIRGYKILISPYFRGSCRFLPSCADYAAEAIARHGVVRGGWLAARRLSRCHPLCAAGHDPVPS